MLRVWDTTSRAFGGGFRVLRFRVAAFRRAAVRGLPTVSIVVPVLV